MKEENRDFRERWKEQTRKIFDSSERRKAFENVFDQQTQRALLKLADREVLKKLYGTIESGKESSIFLADTPENERVLVKIYMTRAGNFREMKKYLEGDKRFRNIKDDRKSVINEWCKKEFRNLKKASNVLNCPKPIAFQENILVMEFIGENFQPYPKLKEVDIENPEVGYKRTITNIEKLYSQEELIHGDLSEYNILVKEDELVWIDFSQGVHRNHPEAPQLLKRDINRISDFFIRQGAETRPDKAFQRIFSG